MILKTQKNTLLNKMVKSLELPDEAYEKAKGRYEDIGTWFDRNESRCAQYQPHIFPQGSFRLGTAIRPLNEEEGYDLDLACELREGVTMLTHTQADLKEMVGDEIKSYRNAKGIKKAVDEKNRCWRLEYADELSFHMDIVPCIPAEEAKRVHIFESMRAADENMEIARAASDLTVNISDVSHEDYGRISDEWNISNPEGFARWFEGRMSIGLHTFMEKAQVDALPIYKRKTPLQCAVQLLKRHRDQMFVSDREVKPISIIITTLAARAYQGENDLEEALTNIILKMGDLVRPNGRRVPNPVDPGEDFADKWPTAEGRLLKLEENFGRWIRQVKTDLQKLTSSDDMDSVSEHARLRLAVNLDAGELRNALGLTMHSVVSGPKVHTLPKDPLKPWCK